MKLRNYIIVLVIAIIVLLVALFYYNRERIFSKKRSKISRRILFVGDSITVADYSYPQILKQLFPGKQIDVLAKGGMRTQWMLDNLKEHLKNNRYDRIYIWGGVNDMFSAVKPEKAVSNVQEMVDLARTNGADAYVIIGYNTREFMADDKLKPTSHVPTKDGMLALKERYIQYQKMLSKVGNAIIVPVFELSPSMTSDAIHPSARAHKIIAEILAKDIK